MGVKFSESSKSPVKQAAALFVFVMLLTPALALILTTRGGVVVASPDLDNTIYDFKDNENNKAWYYTVSGQDTTPDLTPSEVLESATAASQADYDTAENSDDTRWSVSGGERYEEEQYFRFYIGEDVSTIDNVVVTWEGYGHTVGGYDAEAYFWNRTTGAWYRFAVNNSAEDTFTYENHENAEMFIDGDGYLWMAACSYTGTGSCPILYTWNGERFEYIGETSEAGGLGYSVYGGIAQTLSRPLDYVAITDDQMENGLLILAEDQAEISYLDRTELWEVLHPSETELYAGVPAWSDPTEPFPDIGYEYHIHTVKNPKPPAEAWNENGENVLALIEAVDNKWTPKGNAHYHDKITLNLGDLSGAKQIKLLVKAVTGWVNEPPNDKCSYIEVPDENGNWVRAEWRRNSWPEYSINNSRTYVLDITDWFLTDNYWIRLNDWQRKTYDYIAVDTSVDKYVIWRSLDPLSAELFYKGKSRTRINEFGEAKWLYDDVYDPENRFEGRFTRYGDVLPLLESADDMFVIMAPGDAVRLRYEPSDFKAKKLKKDYVLVTDAYYKMDWVKLLFGENICRVEPLPFHAMSYYPYPDNENFPWDNEHLEWWNEYQTRYIEPTPDAHNTLYTDYVKVDIYYTPAVIYPTQPSLYSPDNNSIVNDHTPRLEWTAGKNATSHRLLIDNDQDFSSPCENRTFTTENNYTIEDGRKLTFEENYFFKVIAINENGENESSTRKFKVSRWRVPPIIENFCGEIEGYEATKSVDNDITSCWTHGAGCFHFIVFDFENTYGFQKIRLYQDSESEYRWGGDNGLTVWLSDNLDNWGDNVWEGTLNAAAGWQESGTFEKENARYIKLVSKSDHSHKMYEFQALPLSTWIKVTTENETNVSGENATLNASIEYLSWLKETDIRFDYRSRQDTWTEPDNENWSMEYFNDVPTPPDWGNRTPVMYVAASDSSQDDKDFVAGLEENGWQCDGDADQHEINAAIDNAGENGKVFLFAGNYYITAKIDFSYPTLLDPDKNDNRRSLVGAGKDNTIINIHPDVSVMSRMIWITMDTDGILIENLTINGKGRQASGEQKGIHVMGAHPDLDKFVGGNLVIKNIIIKGFTAIDIYLETSIDVYENVWIINSQVSDAGDGGIVVTYANKIYVDNNLVYNCLNSPAYPSAAPGIALYGVTNSIVANNTVENCGQRGIAVTQYCTTPTENVLIQANTVSRNARLVSVGTVSWANYEIVASGSETAIANDITIRANDVKGLFGIYVYNAENCTLDNNDTYNTFIPITLEGAGHTSENTMGNIENTTSWETITENAYSENITGLHVADICGFRAKVRFFDGENYGTSLTFSTSGVGKPELHSPENNEENVALKPTFEWTNGSSADYHNLLVSTKENFEDNEIDMNFNVPENSYTPTFGLSSTTQYWWKVTAIMGDSENVSDVWTFTTAPVWELIETWSGTIEAPAEWQLIETWTGTVEAPAGWQLIETWTGSIEAPAAWGLIETWSGTIEAYAEWQLVETWTGTVGAPVRWNIVETWSGNIETVAVWINVESWMGSIVGLAEWSVIESWDGSINTITNWSLIEDWSGSILTVVQWNVVDSWTATINTTANWNLIESWNATITAPPVNVWSVIEEWMGSIQAPTWQAIEIWSGTIQAPANWNSIETWSGTIQHLLAQVTTKDATGVTQNSATLNSSINYGSYSSVDIRFQYRVQGTETWENTSWSYGYTSTSYSDSISGLSSSTTYEFRGHIEFDSFEDFGDTLTFTTSAPPPPPPEWSVVEIWTGTVQHVRGWNLIEAWTGLVGFRWVEVEVWTATVTVTVDIIRISEIEGVLATAAVGSILVMAVLFTIFMLFLRYRRIIFGILAMILWFTISALVAASTTIAPLYVLFLSLGLFCFLWISILIVEGLTGKTIIGGSSEEEEEAA